MNEQEESQIFFHMEQHVDGFSSTLTPIIDQGAVCEFLVFDFGTLERSA